MDYPKEEVSLKEGEKKNVQRGEREERSKEKRERKTVRHTESETKNLEIKRHLKVILTFHN